MAKEQENILKKGIANFNLVGEAQVKDFTFTLDKVSASGSFIYNRMSLGVNCGDGNIINSEMMGGYSTSGTDIYVFGKDSKDPKRTDYQNRFSIAWEDRKNPNLLKDVGEDSFIKVGINKDVDGKSIENKFLSAYDAIEYLYQNLEDGAVINVHGNLEYSMYEGEVQIRKTITSVFSSKAKPEDYKAKFTQSILLNTDSLDKSPTENNTLRVYGHVVNYIGKIDDGTGNKVEVKQNAMFPITFELDVEKYGANLKTILKSFFVGKKGWYSELVVIGDLKEGATLIAGSIDDLPEDMKALISMGLISEEEAVSKVSIKGDRERRMIFEKPLITKVINTDGTIGAPNVRYAIEKYKMDEAVYAVDLYNSVLANEEEEDSVEVSDDVKEEMNKDADALKDFLNDFLSEDLPQ